MAMKIKYTARKTRYMETGRYQVVQLKTFDKNHLILITSLHKNGKGVTIADKPDELWKHFKDCIDADEFNHLAKHMINV